MRHVALTALALLLAACATAPPPQSLFDAPVAARKVAVVPVYDPATEARLAQETRRVLDGARRTVQAAQKDLGHTERQRLLQQAEQAAREGNNPRAQSLARQAAARAETAVETRREREAATLLQRLYVTTGLSDAQLKAMRAAETALVRGESAAALKQLKGIQAAAAKPREYTVQRGDSLSAIAARESVYGNSLLWPLLWQANRDRIPDPHKLRAGTKLDIRPSPTVDEVVQAIRTARQYPARVRIGAVKTLPRK